MPEPVEGEPVEEEAPPLTEAEQLQLDIKNAQNESLEATRRCLEMCMDAKEAGVKSLVALDDQREKLENFEKGMRDIYEDMVEAEQAMRSMGAPCWGLCVPCSEALEKDPEPECFMEQKCGGGGDRPPELSMEGVPTYGGFIAKLTNDEEEEEMEKNMEEVSNCVGNLRNMAIDMNNEISYQNDYIVRIQDMVRYIRF